MLVSTIQTGECLTQTALSREINAEILHNDARKRFLFYLVTQTTSTLEVKNKSVSNRFTFLESLYLNCRKEQKQINSIGDNTKTIKYQSY